MSETPYSDELDEILMKLARNTTLADRAAGVASTASTLKDASKIFDWSISEAKAAIQSIIRTEKLKLLAEVRERVVDKPTGNHNADSLLERDVLIYNQATAYLRTELAKLEAEL